MKNARAGLAWTALVVGVLLVAGCSSRAKTLDDPFAYCATLGTIDKPDARYTGLQVPDAIIDGFKRAAGLQDSTEPRDMLRKTTVWRCMDHEVYACNFGANLPCDSKADINRLPAQAMTDYCTANPGASVIPMSVTGHATVYDWRCLHSKPEAGTKVVPVDAAGYLADIWYRIAPAP